MTMRHVVTRPRPPFASASGQLEVHQVPSWRDNLVWLLVDVQSREAAAVDGPEATTTLDHCQRHGLRLTTVLNTHTHADHIGINRDLQARGLLASMRVVGPTRAAADVPGLTESVDEGDEVRFGAVTGRVLLTEGHIDGHISYVFEDLLFCGDTMFTAGCGYLFDGPPERMFGSLERLAALPGETRVCCAHEYTEDNLRFAWSVEPDNEALAERIRRVWGLRAQGRCAVPSTIAEERATNPFLRSESASLRERVAAAMSNTAMDDDAAVFAATRALKNRKDYQAIGDENLPL